MRLKIFFLTLVVHTMVVVGAFAAPKQMFTLVYKNLPFGKTEKEIVEWLEEQDNVVVYEDRAVVINQIMCYKPIAPFFEGGVKASDDGPQFYNYFIKKYTVERCYGIFANTFRADFYFVRDESNVFRLFMVHRVCRVESGAMKDIYGDELKLRIKEFGSPSNSWESTSTGATRTTSERLLPAKVTMWQEDSGSVFFMMADNGMLQFREFLFVWSPGWSMYQKALEKARTWR